MYRKGRQAIMGPFSTSFSRALNFCHAAPASVVLQVSHNYVSFEPNDSSISFKFFAFIGGLMMLPYA